MFADVIEWPRRFSLRKKKEKLERKDTRFFANITT
jgi:hypothetical protein